MVEEKIANPVKNFNYRLGIDGMPVGTCQSIEVGEIEISEIEHGSGNINRSTPGKIKIGDCVIEKLVAEEGADADMWNWFCQAQDQATGTHDPAYCKDITVTLEDGNNGSTRIWILKASWVKKFKFSKIGDTEDSNHIDTITLKPYKVLPVKM